MHAEEIGFLTGGPGRAAETALTRLVEGGVVRISREGHVTAVHQNGYGATTPIEASILNNLGSRAKPITLVVSLTARTEEMKSLHQSLVSRGLFRRTILTRGAAIGCLLVLILFAALVSFIAAIFEPWLFALVFVIALVAFLLRPRANLTALGASTLKHAYGNVRSQTDVVALNGMWPRVVGAKRSSSYSHSGCASYDDQSPHSGCSSCSGSSSCSSSSSSCSSSSSSSSCGGGGSSCSSSSN